MVGPIDRPPLHDRGPPRTGGKIEGICGMCQAFSASWEVDSRKSAAARLLCAPALPAAQGFSRAHVRLRDPGTPDLAHFQIVRQRRSHRTPKPGGLADRTLPAHALPERACGASGGCPEGRSLQHGAGSVVEVSTFV